MTEKHKNDHELKNCNRFSLNQNRNAQTTMPKELFCVFWMTRVVYYLKLQVFVWLQTSHLHKIIFAPRKKKVIATFSHNFDNKNSKIWLTFSEKKKNHLFLKKRK